MACSPITIAVDAMGGDFAPIEIVKGSHLAAQEMGINILLVGLEGQIKSELSKLSPCKNIHIVHAPDVIEMGEHAARAVKSKPNSSISIAAQLVKQNEANAMVSVGNTGAAMSAAFLKIRRIEGIARPAIAVVIPTSNRPVVLLDVGANTECKPENIFQFAVMGKIYASKVVGVDEPTIGLLNVGRECEKGNEFLRKSYDLLRSAEGFIGNVEGNDIPEGRADVIVCDGFAGNVALKLMEGFASVLFSEIKMAAKSSFFGRIGGLLLVPSLQTLKSKLDHEKYGGACLLGIDGVCIVGHGKSNAKAVKNAIIAAEQAVLEDIVSEIKKGI